MPKPRSAARATALAIACAGAVRLAGSASGATCVSDSAFTRPIPPPPVTRAAEWETLETGLPEEARFRPIVRVRYNRVDGPAPTLGAAFQPARAPEPVLFAEGTYAFSRKRPLYEAGFEAPLGDRPWLQVGGSIYRGTATSRRSRSDAGSDPPSSRFGAGRTARLRTSGRARRSKEISSTGGCGDPSGTGPGFRRRRSSAFGWSRGPP